MLPGKKYTPEELLEITWRWKWLIVLPLITITIGTALYTRRLPDLYRSETLILVVPQRIPDSYVKSTVTARIEDRLPTIQQQILTRSRLERIITDLGLYAEVRKTAIMEDLVQGMRRDISVTIQGDTFRVSFVSRNARVAQQVAARLASLFIDENLRDRENQAASTSEFLDTQLEDARRRLIEHEKRLEEYRRQYAGQLPSQLASNLQVIQSAQMQLQALAEAMNRERERRLLIERQIADLEQAPTPAVATPAAGSVEAPLVGTTRQRLEAARDNLKLLQMRFTADHPDVRGLRRAVVDLEARLQVEESEANDGNTSTPLTPAEARRQGRLRELRAELQNLDAQFEQKQAEDSKLRAAVAGLQAKVDALPTRESELVELTRDYGTLQNTYASLGAKREDSKIAANLEQRQIGEQFKILDPAGVPEKPFSPNRTRINLIGAGAGFLFGFVVIAFIEYRDSTFKSDEEVMHWLNVAVLAVIPVMVSAADLRRRARRKKLVGLASAGLLLAVAGGAFAFWRMQS